ncbi:siphovirus ReqiPepy6 Gp37-like family protein [Chengkuizengella sp. SCS-71B]|uniref:siphovirus ReqiPepy6 Gp37-like family protein n=1 Tax=Chengkuizengella sp. SCS-71B TaxID=3115290 RepID=UPI0032C243E3
MKPMRVLSPTMEILAEIDDYESLIFTRSFHEVGEFNLTINRHKEHTDKLIKGNLIILGSDLNKVGIIKHREIGLDESGKQSEQWSIKGIELKGIVGQRITIPLIGTAYDSVEGNVESIIKHYVVKHIVNPEDGKRKMDMIDIAENLSRGAILKWQSRFENLSDELSAISFASGIGWGMKIDLHQFKWILDVMEGHNLTTSQSIHPPVIFSPEFDSLKSLQYSESDYNVRNVGYVAGEGEGFERRIISVGETEGISRIETFIDARDVKEVDEDKQPIPEDQIIQQLKEKGQQNLQELIQEQFLEGQILTHSPFKYEEDYDLGDIVTVQNKDWGVIMDARITEITEIYEPNGFQLEATFGNTRPTLISKLKQELNQIGAEVRK